METYSGQTISKLEELLSKERTVLLELQAGIDNETIEKHERMFIQMPTEQLVKKTALLKAEVLALARMLVEVLDASEVIAMSNEQLQHEVEALEQERLHTYATLTPQNSTPLPCDYEILVAQVQHLSPVQQLQLMMDVLPTIVLHVQSLGD